MFIVYQRLLQDTRKKRVTSCFKCMIVNMSFVDISYFSFFSANDVFCACCVSVAMVKY